MLKVGVSKETLHLHLIKGHLSKEHTMLPGVILLLNIMWLYPILLPVTINWIK